MQIFSPHILAEFQDPIFLALEEKRTGFPVANDLVSRLTLPSGLLGKTRGDRKCFTEEQKGGRNSPSLNEGKTSRFPCEGAAQRLRSPKEPRLHWETPAIRCQGLGVPREDPPDQNLLLTHACPALGCAANLHLCHTCHLHASLAKQISSRDAPRGPK